MMDVVWCMDMDVTRGGMLILNKPNRKLYAGGTLSSHHDILYY